MRKVLVLVLSLVSLVGCAGVSAPWSCKSQMQPFSQTMQPLWTEWSDAVTLAGQTPRMALAGQIANLQSIRRKADAVEVAECGKEIKAHYLASMDATLEGFLGFLGQESEASQVESFTRAKTEIDAATDAMVALK